jgi:hypothetical protein
LFIIYNDTEHATILANIKYGHGIELSEYFRELSTWCWGDWDDAIQELLSAVLKNNLLYSGSEYEVGSEGYTEYFLCPTVDDADLPWDCAQTDW